MRSLPRYRPAHAGSGALNAAVYLFWLYGREIWRVCCHLVGFLGAVSIGIGCGLAACQAVVFLERGVAWCPASEGSVGIPLGRCSAGPLLRWRERVEPDWRLASTFLTRCLC